MPLMRTFVLATWSVGRMTRQLLPVTSPFPSTPAGATSRVALSPSMPIDVPRYFAEILRLAKALQGAGVCFSGLYVTVMWIGLCGK